MCKSSPGDSRLWSSESHLFIDQAWHTCLWAMGQDDTSDSFLGKDNDESSLSSLLEMAGF